jgi:hypothetical protein
MRTNHTFWIVMISLVVITGHAIMGCKSDETPGPPAGSGYDQLITQAWALFSQLQYQQAPLGGETCLFWQS